MSVEEIEKAVTRLKSDELARFAAWFARHHAEQWDEQIRHDARSGKLDQLIARANADFDAGKCKPL